MNTSSIDNLASQYLRLDKAPTFGLDAMPADTERTFAMLAHLFPLIIWPWKRGTSLAVDIHGKEALNFGITLVLIMLPLGIIGSFLGSFAAMLVSLVSLAVFALVIYGAIQARAGKVLRYPFNLRLIK